MSYSKEIRPTNQASNKGEKSSDSSLLRFIDSLLYLFHFALNREARAKVLIESGKLREESKKDD